MSNSKKFYGDIVGQVKPYIIEDINDYDQPISSYQAFTATSTKIPPGQIQLIIPASNKRISIDNSTGLLKTKSILMDGNITGATSISSTTFVGALSGNATTVTNGVYLDDTGTQSIGGNIGVKRLDIDGTRCIYQQGTGGVDTRANLRILQNTSTTTQDGMLINYGSTGGSNSNIKFYANGTAEGMRIRGNTGNGGINETAPSEKLEVGRNITAGNNSYFLSSYASTTNFQFFGGKRGTNSILGGMEIENTTLGGNYSQKVHFRTHYFGVSNGRRLSINEKGYIGINADTPYSMLNIRDTGTNPVLERSILLGYDNNSNFTTTGLQVGNDNARCHLWVGGNGNADVDALAFNYGFGWLCRTHGNYHLIRKNNSTTGISVMTVSRTDGCMCNVYKYNL